MKSTGKVVGLIGLTKGPPPKAMPEKSPGRRPSFDQFEVEDAARILKQHRQIASNTKLHNAAIEHLRNQGKGFRMKPMRKGR